LDVCEYSVVFILHLPFLFLMLMFLPYAAVTSALPENTHLYRFGRMPGTREIVVRPNYLVIYRVTDQIDILAVLHARQKFPEGIQGEI